MSASNLNEQGIDSERCFILHYKIPIYDYDNYYYQFSMCVKFGTKSTHLKKNQSMLNLGPRQPKSRYLTHFEKYV